MPNVLAGLRTMVSDARRSRACGRCGGRWVLPIQVAPDFRASLSTHTSAYTFKKKTVVRDSQSEQIFTGFSTVQELLMLESGSASMPCALSRPKPGRKASSAKHGIDILRRSTGVVFYTQRLSTLSHTGRTLVV